MKTFIAEPRVLLPAFGGPIIAKQRKVESSVQRSGLKMRRFNFVRKSLNCFGLMLLSEALDIRTRA